MEPTGEAYKQVVKLTFARGASLADPRGLFNSSLDGNTRRAIEIREGEVLDASLWCGQASSRRPRRLCLQRAMHPFVAPVLRGAAGLDQLGEDAEAHPARQGGARSGDLR
jgi:hypothetical protein